MGSRTADRRARVEQMRAEQARRERRSRFVILGAGGAVIAAVASGVIWAVAVAPSTGAPAASGQAVSITGLKTYPGLSRNHTNGSVTYQQTPPVGGDHSAVWQNCGWYNTPVASENAVHSLEHSAVWVTYNPDLSAADQATLKGELAGKQWVLASPFPGLPGPVVASAWGEQVVLDGVSDPRLAQFVDTFAGASTAPEPQGECTGGTGNPS